MLRNPRWPLWLAIVTTLLLMSACGPAGPTGPNREPVASFTTSYSGTEVTFDAGTSTDPDGDALAYAWDFGDGTTASGSVAVHRYTEPGTFVAELTVTDGRGGTDTTTATLPVGEVAGDLEVVGGAPLGVPAGASSGNALAPRAAAELPPLARFVPGEVIVRFAEGVRPASVEPRVAGVTLERVRSLALPGAVLYRAPAGVLAAQVGVSDDEATWALVRALQARPDVVEALPNYLMQPHAIPNDPEYTRQWHLRSLGLEQAWDVTTGDDTVVVAVLDTGILYHATDASRRHPDLAGRVLPGYDFVSLATVSDDGDGRDPDPYDPNPDAGYHGTHVAGTIAAATDNDVGIAGVDWAARLLPVRVMGAGGGPLSDVMDGLLWAAGASDEPVPNANPARVVNLSLGASVPCSSTFQDAIDDVVGLGVTIVVSAGNEQASVDTSFPANCRDVIAVGATDRTAERAWYSNHGPRIAVMAPGGDMRTTAANGVYSLGRDPGGAFGYTYAEGTSMAAAHVSGVVALMLSLDGDLTPAEVRALLRLTANPLTPTECTAGLGTSLSGSACGAGLVDAAEAIASLGPTPPPEPEPLPAVGELTFNPSILDFGPVTGTASLPLQIGNVGDAPVAWVIVDFEEAADNPVLLQDADAYQVEALPNTGDLALNETQTVQVTIEPRAAALAGVYRLDLIFEHDEVERRVPVRFEIPGDDFVSPRERTYVGTFQVAADGEITVFGLTEYVSIPDQYLVLTMGGDVRVLAWIDANADGWPDGGDFVGEYPAPVSVAGGQSLSGIDITAEPFLGTSAMVDRALTAIAEAAASMP
jgi:subtilisin family serine protease